MRDLLVACRFLTALPLPRSAPAGDLGDAARWFPLVGGLLGAILAGAALGVDRVAPPLLGAVLVVAAWALLTGGLHLDGLADTLDGLGGGWSRDEALAIMRDVRTGAYGVTGIALVLAVKITGLAGLPASARWRALVVAPVLGRLAPLLLARWCAPAREEGAGHAFALAVTPRALGVATLLALAVGLGLLGAWGLLLLGLVAGWTAAFALYLRWRLGGLTGDCLGALVESVEAGVLGAIAVLAHLGRL